MKPHAQFFSLQTSPSDFWKHVRLHATLHQKEVQTTQNVECYLKQGLDKNRRCFQSVGEDIDRHTSYMPGHSIMVYTEINAALNRVLWIVAPTLQRYKRGALPLRL